MRIESKRNSGNTQSKKHVTRAHILGTRVIGEDELRRGGTPDARGKTRFVLIDCVGVTETGKSRFVLVDCVDGKGPKRHQMADFHSRAA